LPRLSSRLRFGTHQDTTGLGIGHHQFTDVRLRVIETLKGRAVDCIDKDPRLCRHLLALLYQSRGLYTHRARLHHQQKDSDRQHQRLQNTGNQPNNGNNFIKRESQDNIGKRLHMNLLERYCSMRV
jgi:hypothetical protein